ncbi:MAG: ribbon-helix-helix protein, CopG family [Patescibacteria group bacterium]
MNIYFTASSKQKDSFNEVYERVVDHLDSLGHSVFEKVLSEHLADIRDISQHGLMRWYEEWSAFVKDADCVVVEGSYPSTVHVGFELGMILSKHKPVILLHKRGSDPALINTHYYSRLIKSAYDDKNLEEVIDWCLEEVGSISKRRFTFYISPEIDGFLEQIANNSGTSRSEYIRDLIEKEIEESSEA